jgi:hypothetical protein
MLSERFSWSPNVEQWCSIVESHDRHFTYAENILRSDSLVPWVGLDWKTTGRPMELDLWEPHAVPLPTPAAPWTTVMTWNAFKGKLTYDGIEYKSKGAEFEKVIELPQRFHQPFKIDVGGINAPMKRLAEYGWQVVDGPRSSLTPAQYQRFIAGSRGEFSIAKHVYVAMRTGWFSYRSACYLASGRPVVIQDTGFSSVYPVGEGIVTFNTIDEAIEAIQEVDGNYERHSKAARDIARSCFCSTAVLTQLIEDSLGPRSDHVHSAKT